MVQQVLLAVGLTAEERSALAELAADGLDVELSVVDRLEEALDLLRSRPVACLVTSESLPDGEGTELVEKSRTQWPDLGCILCADPADTQLVADGGPSVEFVPRNAPTTPTRLAQLARVTIERRSQTAYPLPADETARLETLQQLRLEDDRLRANAERVTELAALHFEMPIATVNLLYEHTLESFACYGADPDTLDREQTICAHVIATGGPRVIEDVTDSCCAALGAVKQHGIEFYAGAPLLTAAGHPLGTFCVYDQTSRSFDEADRHALELYAAETMAWIEQLGQPAPEQAAPAGGDR